MPTIVGRLQTGAPIIEDFVAVPSPLDRGMPLCPRGLVLHDTEETNANAWTVLARWERLAQIDPAATPSAHIIADWDVALVVVPWRPGRAHVAFHAGKPANQLFLGMELCTSPDLRLAIGAYHNWIAMAGLIFATYGWPVDPGLTGATYNAAWVAQDGICHLEAHLWTHNWVVHCGLSNTAHTDPIGYLASLGISMEQVQDDIIAAKACTELC